MGLGYQFDFLYGQKINAVTSDDIVRVCQKYFNTGIELLNNIA
jgi:predicted Zn-dependent peptidase